MGLTEMCADRCASHVSGPALTAFRAQMLEATAGFEPACRGFADLQPNISSIMLGTRRTI